MATSTTEGVKGSSTSSREGTAKAMAADQISQAIQSTSNLLHLMQQSSPSQVPLSLCMFILCPLVHLFCFLRASYGDIVKWV